MAGGTDVRAQDRTGRKRPPYASTAAALGIFVLLSRAFPQATRDFPSSLPPLFVRWNPRVGPEILVPLTLVVVAWVAIPRLLRVPLAAFLAVLVVFAWVFALTLAIQSGEVRTFQGCCARQGYGSSYGAILMAPIKRASDYFAEKPRIDRLGPKRFAERFPYYDREGSVGLALHARTHPPGAPIAVWELWRLAGRSAFRLALAIALVGAVAVLPTYAIARELYGERAARLAAVLFACCPGVLIYSATSADALFMTATAVAAAALVRAPRSGPWAFAAGALTAAALSLTWGAAALGLVGIGVGLLALQERSLSELIRRGLLAVAGLAVGALVLQHFVGIHLLADFRATSARQVAYVLGHRSYWYWILGDLAAFLVSAGVSNTALFAAEIRAGWRARRPGFETVVLATLAILSVTGLFRGETDHNWLFLLPLVAAAAGNATERVRGAATVGLGQAVLTDALFYTAW